MRRNRWTLRAWWAGLTLITVMAAGCTSGDAVDGATTTSSTSTTTTSTSPPNSTSSTTTSTPLDPTEALHAELLAAYYAANEVFFAAGTVPDENYPGFAEAHTDPILTDRTDVLRELREGGQAYSIASNSVYEVRLIDGSVEVSGDTVFFEICMLDDLRVVAQGAPHPNDGGVQSLLRGIAMERIDGAWKLALQSTFERSEGVTGCVAEWE